MQKYVRKLYILFTLEKLMLCDTLNIFLFTILPKKARLVNFDYLLLLFPILTISIGSFNNLRNFCVMIPLLQNLV